VSYRLPAIHPFLKCAVNDEFPHTVPGGSFYPNGGIEYAFRINFSNMQRDKIVQGMKILAGLLREEFK
jgi:DNA-binding transcriptional MocR family regulator